MRMTRAMLMLLGLLSAAACAPAPALERNGATSIERLDADGLSRVAERLERTGDMRGALSFYLQAVEKRSDDPTILAAVGRIYVTVGERQRAGQFWRQTLVFDPNNGEALIGLAENAIREGSGAEAIDLIDRLHRVAPATARSYNLQAIALDLGGDHLAARRAYAEALLRAPDDPDILSNMALSMALAGEYEAAQDILGSLAEGANEVTAAHENLALVAALQDRTDEAVTLAAMAMPAETARANKPFYQRLASLDGLDKARAVFLGILPPEAEQPAAAAPEPESPPVARETPATGAAAVAAGSPAAEEETKEEAPVERAREPDPVDEPDESVSGGIGSAPAAPTAAALPDYHLQLGAFSSLDRLRRGWTALGALAEAEGLSAFYDSVELDEGVLYRLITGPVTGYSRGREVCRKIAEAGGACVVTPFRPSLQPLGE